MSSSASLLGFIATPTLNEDCDMTEWGRPRLTAYPDAIRQGGLLCLLTMMMYSTRDPPLNFVECGVD